MWLQSTLSVCCPWMFCISANLNKFYLNVCLCVLRTTAPITTWHGTVILKLWLSVCVSDQPICLHKPAAPTCFQLTSDTLFTLSAHTNLWMLTDHTDMSTHLAPSTPHHSSIHQTPSFDSSASCCSCTLCCSRLSCQLNSSPHCGAASSVLQCVEQEGLCTVLRCYYWTAACTPPFYLCGILLWKLSVQNIQVAAFQLSCCGERAGRFSGC